MNAEHIYVQRPDPETFFGNANQLVFLQTALQYFFDRAVLPIYSGSVIINLMDYFPIFNQGYTTSGILADLLRLYNHMHNLYDPNNLESFFPDALYDEAFGDDIVAFHYIYYNMQGMIQKTSMSDAVNQGLTTKPLNTYEVMQSFVRGFDPKHIVSHNLGIMKIINYQTELPELESILQDKPIVDALIDEYMRADEILDIVFTVMGPGDRLESPITAAIIMKNAIQYGYVDLINSLLADDRVNKLIYAILLNDSNMVEQYIDAYDPRDNDNEAYRLALEKGNQQIIQRVLDAVTERNFLEQATFQSMMSYHGPHKELYSYARFLNK